MVDGVPGFDLYRTLGVDPHATTAEVEAAFRARAKREHPDLQPDADAATKRMQRLNVARDWLTDPDRRFRYDQVRGVGSGAVARAPAVPDAPAGSQDRVTQRPTLTFEPPAEGGSMAGPTIASLSLVVILGAIMAGTGSLLVVVVLIAAVVAFLFGLLLALLGATR